MISLFTTFAATSAIAMECDIGLGTGGALVSLSLILLLSSKELISSSVLHSPKVEKAMDLAIIPLLTVFVLNVAYMVTG